LISILLLISILVLFLLF